MLLFESSNSNVQCACGVHGFFHSIGKTIDRLIVAFVAPFIDFDKWLHFMRLYGKRAQRQNIAEHREQKQFLLATAWSARVHSSAEHNRRLDVLSMHPHHTYNIWIQFETLIIQDIQKCLHDVYPAQCPSPLTFWGSRRLRMYRFLFSCRWMEMLSYFCRSR